MKPASPHSQLQGRCCQARVLDPLTYKDTAVSSGELSRMHRLPWVTSFAARHTYLPRLTAFSNRRAAMTATRTGAAHEGVHDKHYELAHSFPHLCAAQPHETRQSASATADKAQANKGPAKGAE